MKAKVEINGKTHEIELTDEQIRSIESNSWEDEYGTLLGEKKRVHIDINYQVAYASLDVHDKAMYVVTNEISSKLYNQIKLFIRMKQFAYLRNNGWEPDWNNERESKYGILFQVTEYSTDSPNLESSVSYYVNQFIFGIAVKFEVIAEEMLSIFKDDILKYYGK